jgi:glycosyltransferase involved in cell wall biosynthesis
MKLSFVIPAHNEEVFIGACLESIRREVQRAPHPVEVVVVNNASTDRTKEIALAHAHVRVIDEPMKGIVRARKAGFRATTGELVANVDADAVLPPGWLARVFAEFARDPRLVCLSGPLVYRDLPVLTQWLAKTFYLPAIIIGFPFRLFFHIGAITQGGNFVLRRNAWEAVGGFDTSIDFYGEDTDVARRLQKIGTVKFTYRLPMWTSGRRLAKEGVVATGMRYALNYLWEMFFNRPFTKHATDIRVARPDRPPAERHPTSDQ